MIWRRSSVGHHVMLPHNARWRLWVATCTAHWASHRSHWTAHLAHGASHLTHLIRHGTAGHLAAQRQLPVHHLLICAAHLLLLLLMRLLWLLGMGLKGRSTTKQYNFMIYVLGTITYWSSTSEDCISKLIRDVARVNEDYMFFFLCSSHQNWTNEKRMIINACIYNKIYNPYYLLTTNDP